MQQTKEPWLGIVSLNSKTGKQGIVCETAVFCGSVGEFATLVSNEAERLGFSLSWYEEVATAVHYAHQGKLNSHRTAICREVNALNHVSFGATPEEFSVPISSYTNVLHWSDVIGKISDFTCVISPGFDYELFTVLSDEGVPYTELYTIPGSELPGSVAFFGSSITDIISSINPPKSLILAPSMTEGTKDFLSNALNVGFAKNRAFYSERTLDFSHPQILKIFADKNGLVDVENKGNFMFLPSTTNGDLIWERFTFNSFDLSKCAIDNSLIKECFARQFIFIVRHVLVEIFSRSIPDFRQTSDPDWVSSLYCWPNTHIHPESNEFVSMHISMALRIAKLFLDSSDNDCVYGDLMRFVRIAAALSEKGSDISLDPHLKELLDFESLDPYTKVCLVEYHYVVKPNHRNRN